MKAHCNRNTVSAHSHLTPIGPGLAPKASLAVWFKMATIAACLLLVAVTGGCASTKVSDRQQLVTGQLPRPSIILVYDFAAPPDSCFGDFSIGYRRYFPGQTGQVFIEEEGGEVVQLDAKATGFPGEFDIIDWEQTTSWDVVRVGDADYLLPMSSSIMRRYASGMAWRVDLEYKNFRHFESSTTISYK